MDLIESRGEMSQEDVKALAAMSKEDLVELMTSLNRNWYQLLESLEQAHTQDMEQLSTRMSFQLETELRSMTAPETATMDGLRKSVSDLEKKSGDGFKSLNSLKTMLGKYTSEKSTGGTSLV